MRIENIVTNRRKLKNREAGAALAVAVITVAVLSVIALTALAFSSTEARIAGADLQRTQTFYATSAAMEKMTNDFSNLFRRKMNPTNADLQTIVDNPPPQLRDEGFAFSQTLEQDTARLNELRAIQGLPSTIYPRVNIPEGPYAGLYSTLIPYKLSSTGTMSRTKVEIKLEREFNNYLVPLFQFGIYSNEDLEFSPGPWMTFNGRVHSNRNVYAMRNIKFLNRISMAGELVRNATRGGEENNAPGWENVWFEVGGINVQSTRGSVQPGNGGFGGPNFSSTAGMRGYHPGSPNGAPNPDWETVSVRPANGTANQFGGQVLTNTTGASELKTPLELAGNSPAELIKRSMTSDTEILSASRYHNKSQIRILIDDENAGTGTTNVAGIPAGKGVALSQFVPSVLDGNVLKIIEDNGTITSRQFDQIIDSSGAKIAATTVRKIKTTPPTAAENYSPPGSNIQGRILIEIVKPDGAIVDVTQQILSLGVTYGEPNGIVYLQRPLWAAMIQGSRDRTGNNLNLENLVKNQSVADGEIPNLINESNFNGDFGFINLTTTAIDEENGGTIVREDVPEGSFNQIVPINVYNVREGWVRNTLAKDVVYRERGITSVVELNMRNLARWVDGIYDRNLLAGTNAVSTNIKGEEGYVVYVSDRRGDRKANEYLSDGTVYQSTNGTVDNEDIYGPNGILDAGEDVIDYGWDATRSAASKKGTLQKNTDELPDVSTELTIATPSIIHRRDRAVAAISYHTSYFRRSVRLFNGEKLSITGASGKLSPTKGITIASENMVYIWGNYNTSGVTSIPAGGSTLNNGGFSGAQVPASIVCDAFFPLSKTWFDGLPAMFPQGTSDPDNLTGTPYRMADDNLASISEGTAVRAGIIAGTTISSLTASPGRTISGLRRSGGIINYPRFLEIWNIDGTERAWSYTGSFIPLFRSTQAISQWEQDTSAIYLPPRRNWSFDQTFLDPNRLPPGTPFFQYVQATGFRQVLRR
jgi:hypothetical protein